jgi:hypothetical protein
MGILRKLPEGFGVSAPAKEVDSSACAAKELPGTAATSRPLEAARNCLRSNDNSLLEAFMRVTSTTLHGTIQHLFGGIIRRREGKRCSENHFSR